MTHINPISTVVLKIKLELILWLYNPIYTNMPKHHICDKNSYEYIKFLIF